MYYSILSCPFWTINSFKKRRKKKKQLHSINVRLTRRSFFLPSVKQASGSRVSSGSTTGCSSVGAPMSTVLPSDELLLSLSF